MKLRTTPLAARLGCGPLMVAVVVGCLLLMLDGVAVASLYHAWSGRLPDFWRNARVAQAVLFLGPLALLTLQWWAFDLLVDWLRPLPKKPTNP